MYICIFNLRESRILFIQIAYLISMTILVFVANKMQKRMINSIKYVFS